MSDTVFGDKVTGGVQNKQIGDHNVMNNYSGEVSGADLDAAVAELRGLIAQLTRDGVIDADGVVRDHGALVAAFESQPGRLRALGAAIAGGAKEAVLSVVKDGVAQFIVALVGRM
jgi:hypothetical protein